ncbi:ketopantoate reductase family protein [Halomonas organivorans]|uniref:2-dehydropantoate 2-reductase n=1 Tax=Halomonas organivorans TaxID=257772 RepID=A0A7W5BVR3_9GAMM|nr:ketopantoate reductase family protein [Halomonas organivorans]MBB3139996.1 2-dehydropantoate 2-reductase [Halomonas organivorans]
MSTLILGPGAVGRLLALHLTDNAPVTLIGRRPLPRRQTLITPVGETLSREIESVTAATLPDRLVERADIVHLTTKAYAAEGAFEAIAPRLAPNTPLVLWQNGYGVQQPISAAWTGPVLCASTTEGVYLDGDARVVHAGRGQTVIGDLAGRHTELAGRIAARLSAAGLAASAVDDIRVRLWRKLAVNAAINPLVARFRIRNGQLRDRPFRPMVDAAIAEVAAIMTAEGIAAPEDGWPSLVWSVVSATANNRASMLQDVLAGRPTEHAAILGPLLEAARHHGLDTPTLSALHAGFTERMPL